MARISATTPDVEGSLLPIECVEQFFVGMSAPRVSAVQFSNDGLHCVSSHEDDALRWLDVVSLQHRETIRLPLDIGVHRFCFTSSTDRLWVAPKNELDQQLYIYSAAKADFAAAYSIKGRDSDAVGLPMRHKIDPRVAAIAACPTSDVAAVVTGMHDQLQFFHPLVSGAVASTPRGSEGPFAGMKNVAWSHDGLQVAVAASDHTAVFDFRALTNGPTHVVANADVFAQSATPTSFAVTSSKHTQARHYTCVGIEFHASGQLLLMTSHAGEVVLVDPTAAARSPSRKRQARSDVVASFFHGHAQRHFTESHTAAIAAQFVNPADVRSFVVQPGITHIGGRHVLFYDGCDGALMPGELERRCSLRYVVQQRDPEMPRAMAVNSKFSIVAIGAKSLTWWSTHAATQLQRQECSQA